MIVKKTLRFPFKATDGVLADFALPSIPHNGPNVLLSATPVASFAQPDPATGGLVTLGSTAELGSQRVPIPDAKRLRGIAIAPDSSIYSCNISVGEAPTSDDRVFRVSPGNPWVGHGLGDTDFILVSQTMELPLQVSSGSTFCWDATTIRYAGSDVFQFALRLELWYDDPPTRIQARAPMSARFRFLLSAAASQRAFAVTQGRTSVSVVAIPSTNTASLQMYEVWPLQNVSGANGRSNASILLPIGGSIALGLIQAVTRFDLTTSGGRATAGQTTRINPIPMIAFDVSDSAGTGATDGHQVDVLAWDAP